MPRGVYRSSTIVVTDEGGSSSRKLLRAVGASAGPGTTQASRRDPEAAAARELDRVRDDEVGRRRPVALLMRDQHHAVVAPASTLA
jgi:hypothetical protein